MLPTIDEFRADAEHCSWRVTRTAIYSAGGLFGFMLLSLAASKLSEAYLEPAVAPFLPAAFFVAGLPIMFWGLRRAEQYQKQFPNLQCRHCEKSLLTFASIVIASRNCPRCGRQVVTLPDE